MRQVIIHIGLFILLHSAAGQPVPSPDQFLSFQYGKTFTPYHLKVQYFKEIAASSSRVKLDTYGTTYEGRPLLLAVISSPENLNKLDSIRLNNIRRTGLSPGEPEDNTVAIVWISFGVHGNEASASETSLALLYELVQEKDNLYEGWLENVVVIIDLCLNPDGHSRYTNWFRQVNVNPPNPFPQGWEHNENWPGGRGNHYLSDLNRDWSWLLQRETKARMKEYHRWMPHVHVDVHEMEYNSSYYFAPAARPFHKFITLWQHQFQEQIGHNHTKYFDKNNWEYFTGETFDLFYPGYGDTYPIFNGAIGMTYEQGGGGEAGVMIQKKNGDTITLQERILHHLTTCLSTVEIVSKNANRLISEFNSFWESSRESPTGKYRTYIVRERTGMGKIKLLCDLLDQHYIEYGTIRASQRTTVFDYQDGNTKQIVVEAGDLIIQTSQPKAILTQVLFDPVAFLEDSLTYDITSWSLPYVFGLEAYASDQEIYQDAIFKLHTQNNEYVENAYAYIMEWGSVVEAKVLANMLTIGLKPRVAFSPFKIRLKEYDPGTLIILRADNSAFGMDFDRVIKDVASNWQVEIKGVESGWTEEGPDLGSNQFKLLEKPKILLIGGEGTSATSFGHIWHYFEQIIGYPITIVRSDNIDRVDLHAFNTIIMPSGAYKDFGILAEDLKEWVSRGGTLISNSYANKWLEKTNIFSLVSEAVDLVEEDSDKESKEKNKLVVFADRDRERLSDESRGAFIRCSVDNTHPLGFGLHRDLFILKTSNLTFLPIENSWNVGTYPEELMISGFVGARLKKKIPNTISFAVEDMGNGRVVYFIDEPLYRGFLINGQLLFANALFFVGAGQ